MKLLSKNTKRNFIIIFPIILILLGFGINRYTSYYVNKIEYYVLTDKNVDIYRNGKKDFTGIITDYKLGKFDCEEKYTMHMKIPKNTINNPVLFFDNVNTRVKVYVDEKEVFSMGQDVPKKGTLCHANIKVPLYDLTDKDEIIMEIGVLSNTTFRGMPICTLINAKDCDIYYLFTSLSHQLLAFFSFILFFIGLCIIIFYGIKDNIGQKILLLSLACLSIFIQVVSAYKVIQLISDNLIIDVYMEYLTRFTTVAIIGFYLYVDDTKTKHRYIHLIVPTFMLLHGIIATLLQIFKVCYLNDSLTLFIFEVILIVIDLIITLLKNFKKKKVKKYIITFLTCISIFCIFALITVFFASKYLVTIFNLLPFFIISIIVVFFIEMMYLLSQSFIASAEKEALTQLAFIDKLTGLSNRRGLDNYISIIRSYPIEFALYSFDLNRLKYINDNFGHDAGDNAIKTFAQKLSTVFYDGFCCRTGGDEFIVIIENTSINDSLLGSLDDQLKLYNNTPPQDCSLSYSVGKKTFIANSSFNISDILREADKAMYKMKKESRKYQRK